MPFKPGEDVTALMTAAPASGADVTAQMTPPPYQPRNVLAEGRASAATSGQPEAPSGFQDWFNNELKPMLEKVARPETISDIAALLVPDASGVAMGARAAVRAAGEGTSAVGRGMEAVGASSAVGRASGYGAVGAALRGDFGKAAIAGLAQPVLRATGRGLQSTGRFIQEVGARPVVEAVPVIPPETPQELTARVTAEHRAAQPPVEAPAAPQAQTSTPAPVAAPAPSQPAAATPAAIARPDAFKAALKAFEAAKETPRAAEVNNAAMLIKRGVAPEQALQTVISNRPPSPAAELAKRLGTPSEAEMNADMASRARKGQKSLMPKYGGEPAPAPQATLSKPTQLEPATEATYRGAHTAPGPENGAPLNDLTGGGRIYPDDVYGPNAVQYYGTRTPGLDRPAFKIIQAAKDKPDSLVTVYRAVPSGTQQAIAPGDWVTISKDYALNHGTAWLKGDYDILSKRVKASTIFTNGDSALEWGYHPQTK